MPYFGVLVLGRPYLYFGDSIFRVGQTVGDCADRVNWLKTLQFPWLLSNYYSDGRSYPLVKKPDIDWWSFCHRWFWKTGQEQKGQKSSHYEKVTNGQTEGRTDTVSCRVSCQRPKPTSREFYFFWCPQSQSIDRLVWALIGRSGRPSTF